MRTFSWIKGCLENPKGECSHIYSDDLGLLIWIKFDQSVYLGNPTGFYGCPPQDGLTKIDHLPVASLLTNFRHLIVLGKVTLLHEIGHHMCNHLNRKEMYRPDEDQLVFLKEIEAWKWAEQNWDMISEKSFPYDHVKHCLQAYYDKNFVEYLRS